MSFGPNPRMRADRLLSHFGVGLAAVGFLAIAQGCTTARVATTSGGTVEVPAYDALDAERVSVLSTALATIRAEAPDGRFVVDRTIVDTTKRSGAPLISGIQHREPERWATPNRAETVETRTIQPVCDVGVISCHLPGDIVAAAGFSTPVIVGDTATVVTRWTVNTGTAVKAIRTTVERFTLARDNGEWHLVKRETISVT
jgi:hypothetical protein